MSSVIQEIKRRLPVLDWYRQYIGGKETRKGRRVWVNCFSPEHDDNSPSCIIDERGYKCFSCQVHGDTIDAHQLHFRTSRSQAISELARMLGIENDDELTPPTTMQGVLKLEARMFRDYPQYFSAVMLQEEVCNKDILQRIPAPDKSKADFTARQMAKLLKACSKRRLIASKVPLEAEPDMDLSVGDPSQEAVDADVMDEFWQMQQYQKNGVYEW